MITLLVLLCIAEVGILSALVSTEHGLWGAFSLVAATAAYVVFFNKGAATTAWDWILVHPLQLGLSVLGYIIAGVVWSFFKYYSYIREGKRRGVSKVSFASMDNTERAITWTAYWPISIGIHVLGDGVYKMFRWVYDQVSGVYDSILERVYKS